MGEWDLYCAVCGGPFTTYQFVQSPDQERKSAGPRAGIPMDARSDASDDDNDNNLNEDAETFLDPAVADKRNLQWLTQMRLLGENEKLTSPKRCFITGLGQPTEYGSVEAEPGSHGNVPTDTQGESYHDGKWQTTGYVDWAEDEKWSALPLHDHCFNILERALGIRKGSPSCPSDTRIDLDHLYNALCSRRGGRTSSLNINYYEFSDQAKEQYWSGTASWEPWLVDPLDIPNLQAFAKRLPRQPNVEIEDSRNTSSHAGAGDPFATMPVEILHQIYDTLSATDVAHLMRTSWTMFNATQSGSFWKRRLLIDMPYLWELLASPNIPSDVNWREVYARMSFQSFPGGWDPIFWETHNKKTPHTRHCEPRQSIRKNMDFDKFDPALLAVASRRRVFDCAQQLLDLYLLCEAQSRTLDELDGQGIDQITRTSVCLHMPHLASPASKEVVPIETFVLAQWSDLFSRDKTLTTQYNKDGFLCYIAMSIGDSLYALGAQPEDDTAEGCRKIVTNLYPSQWVEGLKLTTSNKAKMPGTFASQGVVDVEVWMHSADDVCRRTWGDEITCQRLLVPEIGHTLVGFKGVFGDGKICQLGLIESQMDLSFPRTPCINGPTRKLLWRNALPPPHVSIHPDSPILKISDLDMLPMEALYLGHEYRDPITWRASPSKIVEIAGNDNGQSLQYTWERSTDPDHQDRFTERFGHDFERLKHFPLDGPGGERIIAVAFHSAGRLGGSDFAGFRLRTNRGRQVVFGTLPVEGWDELTAPHGQALAGVFGHYHKLDGNSERYKCQAIGVFTTRASL